MPSNHGTPDQLDATAAAADGSATADRRPGTRVELRGVSKVFGLSLIHISEPTRPY